MYLLEFPMEDYYCLPFCQLFSGSRISNSIKDVCYFIVFLHPKCFSLQCIHPFSFPSFLFFFLFFCSSMLWLLRLLLFFYFGINPLILSSFLSFFHPFSPPTHSFPSFTSTSSSFSPPPPPSFYLLLLLSTSVILFLHLLHLPPLPFPTVSSSTCCCYPSHYPVLCSLTFSLSSSSNISPILSSIQVNMVACAAPCS